MGKILTVAPLASRIRSRFPGSNALQRQAVETIELAPGCETEALPVISLPDEFDRVVSADEHSDLQTQRDRIESRTFRHGATISRRYERALLINGCVYAGWSHVECLPDRWSPIVWRDLPDRDDAELSAHIASTGYFGHWLRDAMLLEALAAERCLAPLSFATKPWPHEQGYRALFDLPGDPIEAAVVKNLWITDDRGLNAAWSRRFSMLRDRLRSKTHGGPGPTHVYMCRGTHGSPRALSNEEEIKEALAKEGYSIIYPEIMEPHAIAASLSGAKVVISIEGSAINHAQYALPSGAAIVAVQPPMRFNAFHRILANLNGIHFGYVVADPQGDGFSLDPSRMLRTLDLVEARIR